ncbi:MAG: methyltransferase domain-containing protein [Verrucomicrobiales bacterium]|nr:methyltransferase domain-containing protein [Verrucomicrobiales bacterium]
MNERPNALARTEDFGFEALRTAERYPRALLREFTPYLRGRVLEVGAGVGHFTALLATLPTIEHLLAIEPEARFVATLRRALPRQAVLEGTIHDLNDPGPWDALVSVNVLEHIRDDAAELAAYRRRLAERNGHLCLFVPARRELYAPLDADFGHYRRYHRPELRAKLQAAGFDVVRLHYFNAVGYFAWGIRFRLLKNRRLNARSVRWFDRWIFPPCYALESRLGWPPFGQSLLAVAQAR